MDLCEIKFKFIRYGLIVYIGGELHEEIYAFNLSDEIEPTEEEWNAVKISVSKEPMIITWILPRRLIRIMDHDEYHDFKNLTICVPKSVMASVEELERKVVEMAHEQT